MIRQPQPPIFEAIAELGQGVYQDGSSTKPAHLYQPMMDWFPQLVGVPIHSGRAVRHTFDVIQKAGEHRGALLDIGCSTGYYLAGLKGYSASIGFERDGAARKVAHLLGLTVLPADLFDSFIPAESPVTVLCLNVHMWAHKQGNADHLMDSIASKADRVFFQTAGKQSGGRYKVPEFKTQDDELAYLRQWFKAVTLLDENPHHGGVRYLWLCER